MQVFDLDAVLGHGVAVTNGHAAIFFSIMIDGDTERCADSVLTTVTLADRVFLVVSNLEVELDMDESDWNDLLQEEVGEEASVSGMTWGYKRFDYESAKSIYDKTVGVQISGLELEQATKGKSSKLIDDETPRNY